MNERELILRDNQLAREGRVQTRHAPFAEHILRIPLSDYGQLIKANPALNSKDAAQKSRAIDELLKNPLGEVYRVRKQRRGGNSHGVVIK